MATNTAAWLTKEKAHPFEVKEAPFPKPSKDEVVVKSHAVAINPVDWKIQQEAIFPSKYPTILGCDVAGEVVEVGSSVTNVKKGDRVTAHAHNLALGGEAAYGAFQAYTLHNQILVAPVPSSLSYEQAAVLPLAVSTAAAGLYEQDMLKLQHPSLNPKPTGETVLIWGGASSVGALTIQFARASGYEVVTTASPHNFDFVKSLGADIVFDYRSKTVVDEITDHLKGKTTAGAYDAIAANGSVEACAKILSRSNGGKFVATVLPPPEKLADGVSSKWFFALNIMKSDVAKAVWIDYLPEALRQGKILAKPDPLIAGKGLGEVQKACDRQAEGVSGAKVVCTV